MKKLTILIAMLMASSAWAEWDLITGNTSGDEYYVETDTIEISKGFHYAWVINNYGSPFNGYLSSKRYMQISCGIPQKYKYLEVFGYYQPMGKGSPASINEPDDWSYVLPESGYGYVIKIICFLGNNK